MRKVWEVAKMNFISSYCAIAMVKSSAKWRQALTIIHRFAIHATVCFARIDFWFGAELSVFSIMLNGKIVIQGGSHESYAFKLLMRLKHKELESHRAGVATWEQLNCNPRNPITRSRWQHSIRQVIMISGMAILGQGLITCSEALC